MSKNHLSERDKAIIRVASRLFMSGIKRENFDGLREKFQMNADQFYEEVFAILEKEIECAKKKYLGDHISTKSTSQLH